MAELGVRMRAALVIAAAIAALAAVPAGAAVTITPDRVVVSTSAGTRAVVERSPLRISFADARGRTVLRQVAQPSGGTTIVPPTPHVQFGMISPPPPTRYGPLGFLVGTHRIDQFAAST